MLKRLINYIKSKSSKKNLLKIAAATALVLVVPAAVVMGEYYPDRPLFDYNNPEDRQGSMTGPVFNSFKNTPSYGFEPAFTDARKKDQTAAGSYANRLEDVTDGDDEIVVRMYVHNNANQSTNADGTGVAKNTRIRLFVPTATDTELRARGYISADNATPSLVEDTVDFVDDVPFGLEYVPGSAIIYNGAFPNGTSISDSVVSDEGALIGYDQMNGNFPGCFDYEATVQVTLKIKAPELEFSKNVAVAGSGQGWSDHATAVPGDKINWLLDYKNVGTDTLEDVTIRDQLPPHITMVPGSVRWIYPDKPDGVKLQDGPLFTTGGINFGDYGPTSGGYVMFSTTVNDDFTQCETTIANTAWIKAAGIPETLDQASVTVRVEDNCNPPQPEDPIVRCDVLTMNMANGSDDVFFVTEASKQNGVDENGNPIVVTINSYEYLVNGEVVQNTSDNRYVFSEDTAPGDYLVQVNVIADVGGEEVSVTSDACARPLTVQPDDVTYRCENLSAEQLTKRKFAFTTDIAKDDEVEVVRYIYDFGDGSDELVTNSSTVEHTYAKKNATYTANVAVEFEANGERIVVRDPDCQVNVKVEIPETPEVCEYNPLLPPNDPNCVPGAKLPNTGAGGVMAGAFSIGAAWVSISNWLTSRRSLKGSK